MRHVAVGVFVVLSQAAGTAFAGTIHFDPPSITIAPGTQSVSFATRAVPEHLTNFGTVSFLIGSLEGLELSFLLNQEIFLGWLVDPPPVPPSELGIYSFMTGGIGTDIGWGITRLTDPPWTSLTLGVLTVDTSELQAGDVRQILVSPELETQLLGSPISLLSSGANQEPLAGLATITVVPEPGMVALMVGAALVVGARFATEEESATPLGLKLMGPPLPRVGPADAGPTLGCRPQRRWR